MRNMTLAAAAVAALLFASPASAHSPSSATMEEFSSQVTVSEGRRGGVRVQVGRDHSRSASRARTHNRRASQVRRHGRGISARRGARCETVKTTRRVGNRTVTRTVRRCR